MLSYSMPVIRLRASGRIRPFLGRSLKKILTSSNLSASSQRILSPEGAVWGDCRSIPWKFLSVTGKNRFRQSRRFARETRVVRGVR